MPKVIEFYLFYKRMEQSETTTLGILVTLGTLVHFF
jgi:hypothetical protein